MSIAKRTYVVPLRRGYRNTQRPQRAKKAVTVLKEFLTKHMKSENVKLAKPLNEYIWAQGIKNPPAKVTVVAEKNDEGVVYADLEGNKLPSEMESKEDSKKEKASEPEKKSEEKAEEKPAKKSEKKESKEDSKETKSEDTDSKKDE